MVEKDAFSDALRRIVRVSKAEVDAEEARHNAMRQRLRDKKKKRKPKE